MTTSVLVLTGVLVASTLNPLQGGVRVGLAGLLLVVPPMLAFWVGRTLVDDQTLQRVVVVLATLALPAAAYGLYQTYAGFPSWDARWIANSGYTALNVGGVTRAFGTFASSAEYASFLGIGVVVWLAVGRGFSRLPVTLIIVGALGTALWVESARSIVVLTVVAVVVVIAARYGLRLPVAALGGVVILIALPWLVGHLSPNPSDSATSALISHQVHGLADPFGQQSTLPAHISMVTNGVKTAVSDPVGVGVGAITAAAGKYAGTVGSTEADPGNLAVATGVVGLLAYVALVLRALPLAYRAAARRRDSLSLVALGVLIVTFLQWFNGAQYAVAPLPWLMLGWLDRAAASGSVPTTDRRSTSTFETAQER